MYKKLESTTTSVRMTDWEQRFCPTGWCNVKTLYTRRDDHNLELWHVTNDEASWLVAAAGPVCLHCRGSLLTLSNRIEDADDLLMEMRR